MIEKLKQLKEKSHMTNQQIAEKSNIPESTVARIFSGKTPNPTIATVVSMARAMGGSVADFLNEEDTAKTAGNPDKNTGTAPATADGSDASSVPGNKQPAVPERDVSVSSAPPSGENFSYEKYYEDMINFYKNALKKKDEWIVRLFWCLVGIMLFILFVLIFDILHPGFGFVKY